MGQLEQSQGSEPLPTRREPTEEISMLALNLNSLLLLLLAGGKA